MSEGRSVSSATLFGLILALGYFVLRASLGPTLGSGLFLLLVGAQILATARLPWSRLGLRWTSVVLVGDGCALVAVGSLLTLRPDSSLLRLGFFLPLVVVLAASSLLLLLDRRRMPEAWNRWRRALQAASPVDILLGRHIPTG